MWPIKAKENTQPLIQWPNLITLYSNLWEIVVTVLLLTSNPLVGFLTQKKWPFFDLASFSVRIPIKMDCRGIWSGAPKRILSLSHLS